MRAIGWIAEKSNFHKGRKNWAVGNELTIDEAREQANKMQMNHWARKATKFNSLQIKFLNWSPAQSSWRSTSAETMNTIASIWLLKNLSRGIVRVHDLRMIFTPWLLGSKKHGSTDNFVCGPLQ
jgi:hypothetical protein